MKWTIPLLAVFAVAILSSGCDSPEEDTAREPTVYDVERPIREKLMRENPHAGITPTTRLMEAQQLVRLDLQKQQDRMHKATQDPLLRPTERAKAIEQAQQDIKDGNY